MLTHAQSISPLHFALITAFYAATAMFSVDSSVMLLHVAECRHALTRYQVLFPAFVVIEFWFCPKRCKLSTGIIMIFKSKYSVKSI